MYICSGDLDSMHQTAALVNTDVRFISKKPLISLFDRMRIGIAFLFRVFG